MSTTTKTDGIYVWRHGVLSVSDLASGAVHLDPVKLDEALAKVNRYAGNTTVPWNDAEHSLLVAKLVSDPALPLDYARSRFFVDESDVNFRGTWWRYCMDDCLRTRPSFLKIAKLWGLLHDVVEVVVGDTPLPVKVASGMSGRSDTIEDQIGHNLMLDQLTPYVEAFVLDCTGFKRARALYVDTVLELIRAVVKNADRAALMVEMNKLHEPVVREYVLRSWKVPTNMREFIGGYNYARLSSQAQFENIPWRLSAMKWRVELENVKRQLDMRFSLA